MRYQTRISTLAIAINAFISMSGTAFAADGLMLEEVLVTAHKRSENLQDVAASVDSFGGDWIAEAGWSDIGKLQQAVPSMVTGGESKSRPYIAIRGIGTRKFDIGADGSIGVFVDDVYNARSSSSLASLMDVERIEVLKGPQGTLYGRNTIGGAINVITRKPTSEFAATLKIDAGNYSHQQVKASVSGSLLEDTLLGRLSTAYSDTAGLLKDTVTGQDNNHENSALRGTLLYDVNDNWELSFVADLAETRSDAVLTDIEEGQPFGVVLVFPLDPRVPSVVADGQEDAYSNAYSELGFVDRETAQYALKAKHSGSHFDFLSITSASDEDYSELRDMDGTVLSSWTHNVAQSSQQFSQEFRLSSVDGGLGTFDGTLNWVVGAFYFDDKAERFDGHNSSEDSIFVPGGFGIGFSNYVMDVDTTSYAVYGQANYAFSETLNLTLGLRHTTDRKDFTYSADTNTPTPPVFSPFSVSDELEFSSTDPKISLDYHFSEEVMAYAAYSEGFKSGGVQFGVGDPITALESFDEERLVSFELGLKSRLMNNRLQLNIAAFQYDYTDQQLQSIILVNGSPTALTQNVGKSDMRGLEVDVQTLINDKLSLDFKYAWLDATFKEFESLTGSYSGNIMPGSPEHAANVALNYQAYEGDAGSVKVNLSYSWKDEQYFSFENDALGTQDSYGVLNLTTMWTSVDEAYSVRLYCNNCLDEDYMLNFTTFPSAFGGGRRTWDYGRRVGAEVAFNF